MKRLFGPFLAAALAVSAFLPAASAAVYSDVPDTGEHTTNILLARELGIMTGYGDGTFKPAKAVPRATAIKALGKMELSKTGETLETYDYAGVPAFADIPASHPDHELYQFSLIVRNAGIFDGDPNNNANPAQLMSREQMAKVLVNAFGLKDLPNQIATVRDIGEAAPYFREPIYVLRKNNVTRVEEYRPKEPVSRGQFASFLVRAHDTRTVKYAIADIEQPEPVTTAVGAMPEFPDRLAITLANGVVVDTPVFWNLGTMDMMQPGDYVVTGTLGDTGRTADIQVIVEDPMGVAE
ncbi:S-layer homology domain-containing protein [Bhargavaea cecembensis]|uniref:S-layer homology domain-containing protein n=1 Tax=Bhargavaea cecembensis TaxID=394098 RepID=UPI00058D20F0|nr:S-layer homology domain-containing protein [Bhargavaea cecembensis]